VVDLGHRGLETTAIAEEFMQKFKKAEADSELLMEALERIAKNGYASATWIAEQALKGAE
jgi:hypothetical protein